MRTVLVSDLHIGTRTGADLVRRPRFAELLAREAESADQVVLLGDVVELRDRPVAEVLERARPFFETLGEAVGDGRIVVVPGNHDHQLLAPWLERRRIRGASPLGLEQTARANAGALGSLARRTGNAEVVLAYPGVWVRDGVYATHGHYLDAHLTVPTFERLGVGVVERMLGGLPSGGRTPDDYESVQAPLYSFLYGLAQGGERTRRLAGSNASARVWQTVHGRDGKAADEARPDRRTRRGAGCGSARATARDRAAEPRPLGGGDRARRRPRDGRGRAQARDRGRARDLRPHPSLRAARGTSAAGRPAHGARLDQHRELGLRARDPRARLAATASSGPARRWSWRTRAHPSFASCSPTTATPSSEAGDDRSAHCSRSPRGPSSATAATGSSG